MTLVRVHSTALLAGNDGVERAPSGEPIAFRIWKAGANPTDKGVHILTENAAQRLLAEQAIRGNLYSIDIDHLSLNEKAPPESHKAAGFFSIEGRPSAEGTEIWATTVQWVDWVRAGLQKSPPEWRYHSPAYDTKKSTGEIMSLLNIALTNNPATWSVTQLAIREKAIMNYSAIAAALFGDDDDAKKEARSAIAKMSESETKAWKAVQKAAFDMGDDKKDEPKKEEAKASEGDDKKDEPKKEETTKAAEDAPDEEAAKAAIAATRELAQTVAAQGKEIETFKKEREASERASVLATRSDLPKELVATLSKMPLAMMRETIASIPAAVVDPAAADKVTATRGAHGDASAYGSQRTARLPPKEHEELRERMTGEGRARTIGWDPEHKSDLVFPQIDKFEARRILAARAATGRDGPAVNPATKGGAR
jgi:hypothetical protein